MEINLQRWAVSGGIMEKPEVLAEKFKAYPENTGTIDGSWGREWQIGKEALCRAGEEFEGVIEATVQGQAACLQEQNTKGELKSSSTATHIFPVMFPMWVVDQEGMWGWSGWKKGRFKCVKPRWSAGTLYAPSLTLSSAFV